MAHKEARAKLTPSAHNPGTDGNRQEPIGTHQETRLTIAITHLTELMVNRTCRLSLSQSLRHTAILFIFAII